MKAEDLKTKTVDELSKLLLDARKEQFNLRFQRSQGALENTAQMRRTKKNIARIKTFITEKTRAEAAPAKAPAAKMTTKKAAPKKAAEKKSA